MLTERKLWDLVSQYRSATNDSRLNGKFLTVENILHCFHLFETATEFLGVFKEIMTEIKNDFIEAIYSRKLTANETDSCDIIERIPYFILHENLIESQKVKNLQLEELQKTLDQELSLKTEHLKASEEMNREMENKCLQLDKQIILNQNEIDRLHSEIKCLRDSHRQSEIHMNGILDDINKENNALKNELHLQNLITNNLQTYKEAHEHLDRTFMGACQDYHDENENPKGEPFNKKANLEMEIKTTLTMDNDLIILENLMLDDFDKRVLEFKQRIMSFRYVEGDSSKDQNLENEKTDKLITKAIMDFNKYKLSFQNEFSQLQMESLMLQNHQAVLINDWSSIHESELESESKGYQGHKEIKASFVIDEKIMNKYSAMIYISNDGKSFYECKEVRYCESCGTKSVICPHDNYQKEKVIKLPSGSTHIKIQRPETKMNSKYAKYFVSKSSSWTPEKAETISNEGRKQSSKKSFRSSVLSSVSSDESESLISFQFLLEDFKNRTNIKRISTRKFDECKVLSIIEDFWATILNEDEYDSRQSEIMTLLDKLYLFYLDRYVHEKASMLSLYDFLNSIIEFSEFSQFMQLFTHVLIANTDSSVMRYLFFLTDCIEIVSWKNEEDFRFFLSVVHPFLNEDDIDGVVLSYISYSENVFNQSIIFEFLLYNFIKQKDPRFTWVKSEASILKTAVPGFYTFKEFQILLESVTSFPNKKLSIRLFKELAICYCDEGVTEAVPFSKIAEIVSFLSLLESVERIKEKLQEKYNDSAIKKSEPMRWSFSRLTNLASKLLREN